jgi:hypothetical protein
MFSSFEQNFFVPPRYFLVTYKLNPKMLQSKIIEGDIGDVLTNEHKEKVKLAVEQ